MRTHGGSGWRPPLALAAAAVGLSLLLAGCGGGSSSEGKKSGSASANTVQPAGSWTMVRWSTSRSDDPTAGRGQAVERRLSLKPSCDKGRCDIAVTPDGVDGTYLPEGYASVSGRRAEPYTFSWKEATKAYEYVAAPSKSTCTTVEGTVVPDAYELTATTSLRFTPAEAGRPAGLHGTYTEQAKGIGAGIKANCTDHESLWSVAAAPTPAKTSDRTDLSGTYAVTEIVEAVVPAGTRVPGFIGVLIPSSKVEKKAPGYTVTGVGPAPTALTLEASGWSGTATATTVCNLGKGDIPAAFTIAERWIQLRPAAVTRAGKPVITGRWQSDWTPTASGAKAGCSALSNKGYVIFVPEGA